MKNKNGNVAVVAIIIMIVATTASVITWFAATKTQAPATQTANDVTKLTEPIKSSEIDLPSISEDAIKNTDTSTQPAIAKPGSALSNNTVEPKAPQVNAKSAIILTIKSQSGKTLKGITCAVKADEGGKRMIPEVSKKSDSKGICSFQNLDPAFPYLVRVYWTDDESRVSDVSLSWIPAGTTVTREIIKPASM